MRSEQTEVVIRLGHNLCANLKCIGCNQSLCSDHKQSNVFAQVAAQALGVGKNRNNINSNSNTKIHKHEQQKHQEQQKQQQQWQERQ
eukprot:3562459-Amphidinium_carterae.1